MELNEITGQIVDGAIKVHSALGPGMLESAYEKCLLYELQQRGLTVEAQVKVPLRYEDITIDAAYRIDLLVEESVIVEFKSVEKLLPVHKAQLLSYLKLSGKKVGLLLNFQVNHMKNGISRLANDL